MSSKSHIYYSLTTDLEIYHETNEPRSIWGELKGYDIYMFIPLYLVDEWKIKGDYLFIKFKTKHADFPQEIKFWGGWIVEAYGDDECLAIIIQGGSPYDKRLSNKEFYFFDINNQQTIL